MANIELLPALLDEPLAEFCARAKPHASSSLAGGALSARAQEFQAAFAWLWSAERLPRGFRWTFQNGPGVERRVRELARSEHACCPFLSFAVSTKGDLVIWEGHGPANAEDLIEEFFALSLLAQEPEPVLPQLTRRPTTGTN